ncbi:MAG: succinyldiaminopimelate transaminase [Alphaproteobacteria bacterium]|nr:succinyldiaminopimelate transaminase [Alphaproteobacteria bacterium]
MNPLLTQLSTYPTVALDEKKRQVRATGRTLYDFGVGDPIEPTPPHIREAMLAAIPEVSQYPTVQGPRALREAIAAYMARRFGVTLDPATQILPTSGSKEAVFHLPLAFIDPAAPDRTVVFPDPGYPAYSRGALFAGAETHCQRLEGDFLQRPWEIPEDVLRRTRMLWINSPHNPTGAVMSLAHLAQIHALCRRHDILLVADECYADVYDDAPPPSLLQVSDEGVLVIHSCSKRSGMTGYRSGFVAGDPRAVAAYRTLRVNPGVAPTDMTNAAAAAAWADDAHADARRALLRRKKAVFLDLFQELGLELVGSEATFYLWVRAPEGHDEQSYALALLEHGIVVSPGTFFGVSDAGAGYVRVAMVPPLEACREAAAIWRTVHREVT